MNIALITGSAGLIGSESVTFFSDKFDLIIGIDNNYRENKDNFFHLFFFFKVFKYGFCQQQRIIEMK